jgi:hypothetical protein
MLIAIGLCLRLRGPLDAAKKSRVGSGRQTPCQGIGGHLFGVFRRSVRRRDLGYNRRGLGKSQVFQATSEETYTFGIP